MEELLKTIYGKLKVLGYNVYNELPAAEVPYPFIEYKVNEVYRNVNPKIYTLTIDVWDRNDSVQRVEVLTSQVDAIMEEVVHLDTCLSIKVRRQSRLNVADQDARIKRRQLEYQLRVFGICEGVD